MYYYAQINEHGVCIGVSSLAGEVNESHMIRIPEYNDDYIGRKYENGEWSEKKYLPDYSQIELDRIEAVEQAIAELSVLIGGGADGV